MKVLVVIDMQNDFISGSLGSEEAKAIVPNVTELIKNWEGPILATKDTHSEQYLDSFEGKHLPIKHCVENTDGWNFPYEIIEALNANHCTKIRKKSTFGSFMLLNDIDSLEDDCILKIESITFCGLCTDVCVISNVLMARASFKNTEINVVANACAGTTPEKHKAALEVMKSCQINII